jgi:hypothetical protein
MIDARPATDPKGYLVVCSYTEVGLSTELGDSYLRQLASALFAVGTPVLEWGPGPEPGRADSNCFACQRGDRV